MYVIARMELDNGNSGSKRFARSTLVVLLICFGAGPVRAQEGPAPSLALKFAVILIRHGVRSPTWSTEQLNQYSTAPWPEWHVPPGNLTPHGKTLMQLFGAYDRAYLVQAGLLSPTGCADAGDVYFRADPEERNLETGRALAVGMLPGCALDVHSLPEGTADPLFSPIAAGIGRPDRALAVAAVLGRIGGDPGALLDLYRPGLETMQEVLIGCQPGTRCPPEGKTVKQSLFELPASVGPGKVIISLSWVDR